ncbi:hypothetical protein EVAR_47151_1 [Eumeta japonica]|uniref:Uncharacterized protein n=1 Tax=Eumeta variegata TaxID=151549 RepID=A0A4C1XWI7_EUMVA|nr:hypothetical protein EVAR_47151_1 [Eumeta japonica]
MNKFYVHMGEAAGGKLVGCVYNLAQATRAGCTSLNLKEKPIGRMGLSIRRFTDDFKTGEASTEPRVNYVYFEKKHNLDQVQNQDEKLRQG